MSHILMCPFAKTSAFVGVATGNINARLTAIISGKRKYVGLTFNSVAFISRSDNLVLNYLIFFK